MRITKRQGNLLLGASVFASIGLTLMIWCAPIFRAKADSFSAATYDCSDPDKTVQIITATTTSTVTVILSDADYTIAHLGIQNDGTTASVSTDYAVMMASQTAAGAAITMDATYADGAKIITPSGVPATFNASLIPGGADGQHEVQIKASGHGCKMQLIRGHKLP